MNATCTAAARREAKLRERRKEAMVGLSICFKLDVALPPHICLRYSAMQAQTLEPKP